MRTRLYDDSDDYEFVGHIPGSGVAFAAIGQLHTIDLTADVSRAVSKQYRTGIRLAGPERLVSLATAYPTGDLVVRVRRSRAGIQIGRPLQVKYATNGVAIALDDPSLGSWRRATGELLALDGDEYGPAAVWHVLSLWDIFRCPRCGSAGSPMLWGMPAGPVVPKRFIGGCVQEPLGGEIACSVCESRWDRHLVTYDRQRA